MGTVLGLFLRPRRPPLLGKHAVGCLRERLPAADGGLGLLAQVHYPADAAGQPLPGRPFKWFRPEVVVAMARSKGLPPMVMHSLIGGPVQFDASRPPARPTEGDRWPVVVLSHGLWGTCEMYTQLCRDLASCGYIVVALEHEDGSAMYATKTGTGEEIEYIDPPKGIRSSEIPDFRFPFLERRTAELRASTAALVAAAAAGTEGTGHDGPSRLAAVLALADPARMLLVSHSFGGAAVLRYLRRVAEAKETCPFKGVILSDLWHEACVKEDLGQALTVPYALVQSESWAKTELYAVGNQALIDANPQQLAASLSVTGTLHQWISETQLVAPAFLLRKLGIAGSGEHRRVYGATARAVALALSAMLGSAADRESLERRCIALDSAVLRPWGVRSWRAAGAL